MKQPKLDINRRRQALQPRTVAALVNEAAKYGLYAAGVFDSRTGTMNEVHVFTNGRMTGSVFRPTEGGLAVWTFSGQRRAANIPEAIHLATTP